MPCFFLEAIGGGRGEEEEGGEGRGEERRFSVILALTDAIHLSSTSFFSFSFSSCFSFFSSILSCSDLIVDRCAGMLWDALGCSGMLWDALGCSGMLWDARDASSWLRILSEGFFLRILWDAMRFFGMLHHGSGFFLKDSLGFFWHTSRYSGILLVDSLRILWDVMRFFGML